MPVALAFCIVVALSLPAAGVVAVALGSVACLATAGGTWRAVAITR